MKYKEFKSKNLVKIANQMTYKQIKSDQKIYAMNIMPYNRISDDVKRRIVEAHEREEDYREVARLFGVKMSTAYSIIRRHQEDGLIVRPRGGHRFHKMDDDMKTALVQIVEEHATFTLAQINTELHRRLPMKPRVSLSTVATALDGQLIHIKQLEDAPVERNSPATKEARRVHAQWLMAHGIHENLVYVDECGFNLFTRRTRGRAARGQRAVRQVAGSRGKHLNLIMAIAPNVGLLYHEICVGSVNGERFQIFLDNLSTVIGEEFRAVVLMDNAPIHRNPGFNVEQHEIRKLPPYSPMLNSIENAFSCVKAHVKRAMNERMQEILDRNLAAAQHLPLTTYRVNILQQIVRTVLESGVIDEDKCQNWHRRTLTFVPACLNGDDILM